MGNQLEITALPGVFSQIILDVGTAVLLPYLNQVKSGKIADFGCGAGIDQRLFSQNSNPNQHIFALDVDAFALRSTELTFQKRFKFAQLHLQPVTGFADAPKDLDAIVSNPPFHQGIHTNYHAAVKNSANLPKST